MRGLAGKTALVTGSTNGIGAATARRLAAEGAQVLVTGRSSDRGGAVVEQISAAGGLATFVAADLTREDDVAALVEAAINRFGSLEILVNNAAPIDQIIGGMDGDVCEITKERMSAVFEAGVATIVWCCKYAMPQMRAAGGAVVNVTSIAAFRGRRHTALYSMLKGALNALTLQLAVDYAPQVRVNGVVVGPTLGTDTIDQIVASSPEIVAGWSDLTLTRLATADDVAASIAFLVSSDSAATTGSFVFAEAGQHAWNRSPKLAHLFNS